MIFRIKFFYPTLIYTNRLIYYKFQNTNHYQRYKYIYHYLNNYAVFFGSILLKSAFFYQIILCVNFLLRNQVFNFSTPTFLGEDNYDFNLKNNLVPIKRIPYFEDSEGICDLEEYNESVQRKVLVDLFGSDYENIDNPQRETDTIILEELIKKNYHQTKNSEIFDLIKILVFQKEKYEYNRRY